MKDDDDIWSIHTAMEDFSLVRDSLEKQGVEMESAALAFVPKNYVPVDKETAEKLIRFNDALEDLDDVQNIYFNFDLPDDFEG